ncbi:MAG: hypothetical protein C0592_01510 [Marinilabiliales bacterium]|nr:MAG: hypothetical protein C0592_01510 [Marinilabiliales bacterium]
MARKKRRYKKITIAISADKAALFDVHCRNKKLTPNKFFRKVIYKELEHFDGMVIEHEPEPRQLDIFDANAPDHETRVENVTPVIKLKPEIEKPALAAEKEPEPLEEFKTTLF